MNATDTPERTTPIFNGRFTITNTETGEHRTVRIRTQPDDAKFMPGKRIVGLLTGPDNTRDFTQFAFIDDKGVAVWKKKRGQDGKWSAYEWIADMLWTLGHPELRQGRRGHVWGAAYTLLAEERCIKCNRVLTDPVSIATGIGPVCAGRQA